MFFFRRRRRCRCSIKPVLYYSSNNNNNNNNKNIVISLIWNFLWSWMYNVTITVYKNFDLTITDDVWMIMTEEMYLFYFFFSIHQQQTVWFDLFRCVCMCMVQSSKYFNSWMMMIIIKNRTNNQSRDIELSRKKRKKHQIQTVGCEWIEYLNFWKIFPLCVCVYVLYMWVVFRSTNK